MDRWLRTAEDRISVVVFALLLAALVGLSLAGVGVAVGLLAFVVGMLLASLAGYGVGRLLVDGVSHFRLGRLVSVWLLHLALLTVFAWVRLRLGGADWLRRPDVAFLQALLFGYAVPVWFVLPNRVPQGRGRTRVVSASLGLHGAAFVLSLVVTVMLIHYGPEPLAS